MESYWEEAKVDDQLMRIYVGLPDGSGSFPGVVVIQHQAGVDGFVHEMVRRIVGAAPDLYHRDGPDCTDGARARKARLRDETIIRDVGGCVQFLKRNELVGGKKLGIGGFCMGGRVSYLMAGVNSDLKAAVVYYGGNLFASWGNGPSPFERTAQIQCPIMGHFGEDDENPSPEEVQKLEAELSRHAKVHEFYSYAGAGHAFMDNRAHSYRPHADEISWSRTLEFFRRHLG